MAPRAKANSHRGKKRAHSQRNKNSNKQVQGRGGSPGAAFPALTNSIVTASGVAQSSRNEFDTADFVQQGFDLDTRPPMPLFSNSNAQDYQDAARTSTWPVNVTFQNDKTQGYQAQASAANFVQQDFDLDTRPPMPPFSNGKAQDHQDAAHTLTWPVNIAFQNDTTQGYQAHVSAISHQQYPTLQNSTMQGYQHVASSSSYPQHHTPSIGLTHGFQASAPAHDYPRYPTPPNGPDQYYQGSAYGPAYSQYPAHSNFPTHNLQAPASALVWSPQYPTTNTILQGRNSASSPYTWQPSPEPMNNTVRGNYQDALATGFPLDSALMGNDTTAQEPQTANNDDKNMNENSGEQPGPRRKMPKVVPPRYKRSSGPYKLRNLVLAGMIRPGDELIYKSDKVHATVLLEEVGRASTLNVTITRYPPPPPPTDDELLSESTTAPATIPQGTPEYFKGINGPGALVSAITGQDHGRFQGSWGHFSVLRDSQDLGTLSQRRVLLVGLRLANDQETLDYIAASKKRGREGRRVQ